VISINLLLLVPAYTAVGGEGLPANKKGLHYLSSAGQRNSQGYVC